MRACERQISALRRRNVEMREEPTDWRALSVPELRAVQVSRLRSTLRAVYDNVAPYRSKCDDAGVHPNDLQDLADLRCFPFTAKEDLRAAYPFGHFAVSDTAIARLHASSGTTGRPTVVGYTAKDIATWAGLMARTLAGVGVRPGDKVQIAFGYGLFTGGLGFHYGAERLGAAVIPTGGGGTERQVQLIRDLAVDVVCATPSYMLVLADAFERQGLARGVSRLRLGIFGGEPCSERTRSEFESKMGITAFDTYGLSEVIGPGVASELPAMKGTLTVFEDHFLPEIVDPETGAPLPDGERGELVLTTLTKEAMPVIRYRTRDLTRMLPADGNAMRRIERIADRSDDMLIVRGVNVFPSQLAEILQEEPRFSPHHLIQIARRGRLDEVTILVERRPDWEPPDEGDARRVVARVAAMIKSHVGLACILQVVEPETLERPSGKATRVVDLRPKG
jgi:phenylacetate-CoA ligase